MAAAHHPHAPRRRSALALTSVVVAVVLLALVAGGIFVVSGNRGDESEGAADRFTVRRGSFDITVPASGELAAAQQNEVKNQLETRATITEIVAEGVTVKAGDVLIRLNDDEVRQRVDDAEDSVNTARNAMITAEANLEITKHSNASELAKADLAIKLAELALNGWEEGDVVSMRSDLALELETAEKDFERLEDRFKASLELLEDEYISKDEFRRDEIDMIKARSRLGKAKLAIRVYEEYTYQQERAKFESDFQQAKDERIRIVQRHQNDITRLESDLESRKYQLGSMEDRLAKYERQLDYCIILAPQDGLIVYQSSLDSGGHRRGGDDEPPQVGTELRRGETVILLPDTSKMLAEVKVNEALSGKIKPGQHVTLVADAVPDAELVGAVLNVGVLAESGGWRDPNRRDYTVRIALLGPNELGLKPSMRCKSRIFVARVDDAVFVPIQAIFRNGVVGYVYRPDGSGYAQHRVTTGRSSELYIEVVEGLEEGDSVLMREPAPERITSQIEVGRSGGDRLAAGPPAGDAVAGKGRSAQPGRSGQPGPSGHERRMRGDGDRPGRTSGAQGE